MVKNISVRRFRSNMAKVLDNVRNHFDRYIILNRGEPEAVLMCIDDYEGWLETLEIMSSKKVMADIVEAKKELHEGKYYTFGDVFGKSSSRRKKSKK